MGVVTPAPRVVVAAPVRRGPVVLAAPVRRGPTVVVRR